MRTDRQLSGVQSGRRVSSGASKRRRSATFWLQWWSHNSTYAVKFIELCTKKSHTHTAHCHCMLTQEDYVRVATRVPDAGQLRTSPTPRTHASQGVGVLARWHMLRPASSLKTMWSSKWGAPRRKGTPTPAPHSVGWVWHNPRVVPVGGLTHLRL